ncbi:protein translocase subunit secA [Thermodesulfobium acidiphilum]|uniref:Protein translocase subunit SecA n=1 Tax=Thermodesulfobium acidiphilum TaxID=1794699 RepID=A0A2R4W088_THEAF|nr:preprotein translocase subunit SecA [Thermodesulfobium acidiphilum]AWB10100.1 protein translocase subunit secA [Thermodesulfobium acidiphilum]
MFNKLLSKILGSSKENELKKYYEIVATINNKEEEIKKLTREDFLQITNNYREALKEYKEKDFPNEILINSFAMVREASLRTLGLRHFDVQLIGGLVLNDGKIAEMATGEGKTLAATTAAYLNALSGKGVHIVTVNDYLAKRDAEWMKPVYEYLGVSVGYLQNNFDNEKRKAAYNCDITYGVNHEFGFDYLRDNMALSVADQVQRGLNYAIVDEVDSILIDEARTPLIISGRAAQKTELYNRLNPIALRLKPEEDFTPDEKTKTLSLTEVGVAKAEKLLGIDNLFDVKYIDVLHVLTQLLRAHHLFKREKDYVVKDGEVIIVDEFTGRLMHGRRYSDGLHQAIEAKEHVRVREETQTIATITIQNYFRSYAKLAGMTGTAKTDEAEFIKIYNLMVVEIPTNKPVIRVDFPDVIYKNEEAKLRALIREIQECFERGQPVLVGTTSIEKSEKLSLLLKKKGIPHHVLNAKYHEKEAEIISHAGEKKSVTIATNMAGRGVDIVIDDEVRQLGGLHVIGTSRHESRRIDNQLRGRAGRQGDPGSSRFYLSLDDDLLRLFGSDRLVALMDKLNIDENEPIEHKWVTKAVENAQKKVEENNFAIRKQLIEYDDVLNRQREYIYSERQKLLTRDDCKDIIVGWIEQIVEKYVDESFPKKTINEEGLSVLKESLQEIIKLDDDAFDSCKDITELKSKLKLVLKEKYSLRESELGSELLRSLEKYIALRIIDEKWMEYLQDNDSLREGIGLRAYGQKDPLVEYKIEASKLFQETATLIKKDTLKFLFNVIVEKKEDLSDKKEAPQGKTNINNANNNQKNNKKKKIGRNDPCPCGSGKKYKHCCGRNET